MALLRGKWTETLKCQSNPSSTGEWHASTKKTCSNLVDVHERSGGVREHVLVADGEDGVLPVDGHQAGVRLQDDVRMSVLFVSGMKKVLVH